MKIENYTGNNKYTGEYFEKRDIFLYKISSSLEWLCIPGRGSCIISCRNDDDVFCVGNLEKPFFHTALLFRCGFSRLFFFDTRDTFLYTHTHTCHAIVNSSFWCVSLLAWHSIRNKKGKQKEQKFLATLMIEVEVIALSRFRSTSHARWRCVVRSFVQKIKNGREEEKEKKRRSGVVAMYL
jgi:hypothetical protein